MAVTEGVRWTCWNATIVSVVSAVNMLSAMPSDQGVSCGVPRGPCTSPDVDRPTRESTRSRQSSYTHAQKRPGGLSTLSTLICGCIQCAISIWVQVFKSKVDSIIEWEKRKANQPRRKLKTKDCSFFFLSFFFFLRNIQKEGCSRFTDYQ